MCIMIAYAGCCLQPLFQIQLHLKCKFYLYVKYLWKIGKWWPVKCYKWICKIFKMKKIWVSYSHCLLSFQFFGTIKHTNLNTNYKRISCHFSVCLFYAHQISPSFLLLHLYIVYPHILHCKKSKFLKCEANVCIWQFQVKWLNHL